MPVSLRFYPHTLILSAFPSSQRNRVRRNTCSDCESPYTVETYTADGMIKWVVIERQLPRERIRRKMYALYVYCDGQWWYVASIFFRHISVFLHLPSAIRNTPHTAFSRYWDARTRLIRAMGMYPRMLDSDVYYIRPRTLATHVISAMRASGLALEEAAQ